MSEVEKPSQVVFDYIKSPDFRTILCEGVIGGITPQRKIHCALYSERPAIPQRQVFNLSGDTPESMTLGTEDLDKQVGKKSIVREMGCDIVMTAEVAENLGTWLITLAQELKKGKDSE